MTDAPEAVFISCRAFGEWKSLLRFAALSFDAKLLARTGDGESFIVQKLFNAYHIFNVAAAIHSLAGAALARLELWELGLPEPKDVCRQAAQARHFTNAEIEFIRHKYGRMFGRRGGFSFGAHFPEPGEPFEKTGRTPVFSTTCGAEQQGKGER